MAVTGLRLKAHYHTRGRKGNGRYVVTQMPQKTRHALIVREIRLRNGCEKLGKLLKKQLNFGKDDGGMTDG